MVASYSDIISSQPACGSDKDIVHHPGVTLPHTARDLHELTLPHLGTISLYQGQIFGEAASVARVCHPDDFVHARDANGVRQLAFNDINEANNWLHANLPPRIPNDRTINLMYASRARCVRILVDAVYDLSQCNDSTKMQNHFRPHGNSYFKNLEVEAACHVLFDNLIELCRNGFRGLRKFNLLTKKSCPEEDKTADCGDRFNNIVKALRTWKSICKGMIEEDAKKWQLVNAPLYMVVKKKVEKGGNNNKKDELKALKKEVDAAGSGPCTPHLAAPTQIYLNSSSIAVSLQQLAPHPSETASTHTTPVDPTSGVHISRLPSDPSTPASSMGTEFTYAPTNLTDADSSEDMPPYHHGSSPPGYDANILGFIQDSPLSSTASIVNALSDYLAVPHDLPPASVPWSPMSTSPNHLSNHVESQVLYRLPQMGIGHSIPPPTSLATTNHGESMHNDPSNFTKFIDPKVMANYYNESSSFDYCSYFTVDPDHLDHGDDMTTFGASLSETVTISSINTLCDEPNFHDHGQFNFPPEISSTQIILQPPQTVIHGDDQLNRNKRAREDDEAWAKLPRRRQKSSEDGTWRVSLDIDGTGGE